MYTSRLGWVLRSMTRQKVTMLLMQYADRQAAGFLCLDKLYLCAPAMINNLDFLQSCSRTKHATGQLDPQTDGNFVIKLPQGHVVTSLNFTYYK